jgi:hypothetical protein
MKTIIITYILPPIPDRSHDWCAYFDGQEEEGPYGYGPTAYEALDSLFQYFEESELDNEYRLIQDGVEQPYNGTVH